MNKIVKRMLADNPDSIFVFDIDGVLASYEYCDFNHGWWRLVWENIVNKTDPYQYARPFRTLQKFIAKHRDRCYVCSKTSCENESKQKSNFVYRNYKIPKDRIFFVDCTDDKLEVLSRIYDDNSWLQPEHIAIVEDTIATLDYIHERSLFSTIHISSFLE